MWLGRSWRAFSDRQRPAASSSALRNFLKRSGLALETAPAVELLDGVMRYYAEVPFAGLSRLSDADMLLFQYGCYDWNDGAGERFSISLCRQFAAGDRSQIFSQLRVVQYFMPDTVLRSFGAAEAWCADRAQLDSFRALVLCHPAVLEIAHRRAERREVRWEKV